MRNLNRLFLRCLVSRIRCVRDILNIKQYGMYSFFDDCEKLNLVLSLQHYINSNEIELFVIAKRKSLSFLFGNSKVYSLCLKSLFFDSMLPITEFASDRVYIIFRPYRYCQDVLLKVKNLFFSKINFPWMIKIELFTCVNKYSWLSKNFPFYRLSYRILYRWNVNNIKDKFIFSLFNLLLNGFVWCS